MPAITRQSPSKVVQAPSVNGSILSRAVPVDQIEDQFVKMVIYGANRVGKTTLACDFPKPLLLVTFEPNKTGGALSVKKVKGLSYVKITSSSDGMKLAKELEDNKTFKTHVLDGATSYQDIILQEILGTDVLPEQLNFGMVSTDQYRQRSERLRECLRPYLNLNAHTVVLAKERDHSPPKGLEAWESYGKRKVAKNDMRIESFFASDVGGATAGWLHDACDYIGRLYLDKEVISKEQVIKVGKEEQKTIIETETGRVVHRLRTLYHSNFAAGFRSATPDAIPVYIENPKYADIAKVIAGERISNGSYE